MDALLKSLSSQSDTQKYCIVKSIMNLFTQVLSRPSKMKLSGYFGDQIKIQGLGYSGRKKSCLSF
jgi:RNA binding exosome subunit